MAEYPNIPKHVDIIVQALHNVDERRLEAQARAQMVAQRYEADQYLQQLGQSRAYAPPSTENDFPIKFILGKKGFDEFHSLMERGRGETNGNRDYRLLLSSSLIGYLLIHLSMEVVKWLI